MESWIYLDKARTALKIGRYNLVSEILESCFSELSTAEQASAQALCSLAASAQEDYSKALAVAELSLHLNPVGVDGLLAKSLAFGGLNFFEEAEDVLREAIRLAPYNPGCYYYLAKQLLQQNRFSEAEAAARKSLTLDPMDEDIFCLLAWIQLARDDEKGAAESVQKALSLAPNNSEALRIQGTMAKGRGEQIQYFKTGLFFSPTDQGLQKDLWASKFTYPLIFLVCLIVSGFNSLVIFYASQPTYESLKGVGLSLFLLAALALGRRLPVMVPFTLCNILLLYGAKEMMQGEEFAPILFSACLLSALVLYFAYILNSMFSNYYYVVSLWGGAVKGFFGSNTMPLYLRKMVRRRTTWYRLAGASLCTFGVASVSSDSPGGVMAVFFSFLMVCGEIVTADKPKMTMANAVRYFPFMNFSFRGSVIQVVVYFINHLVMIVYLGIFLKPMDAPGIRKVSMMIFCWVFYLIMVETLSVLTTQDEG